MAFGISETFTGVEGQSVFDVEEFDTDQESVYLNRLKLIRNIDYNPVQVTPPVPGKFDSIQLVTPIGDDTDILEVISLHPDIVAETIEDKIDDILTAVVGSWRWDKVSGVLTMVDTGGNDRFSFDVKDDVDEAERERRQDREI